MVEDVFQARRMPKLILYTTRFREDFLKKFKRIVEEQGMTNSGFDIKSLFLLNTDNTFLYQPEIEQMIEYLLATFSSNENRKMFLGLLFSYFFHLQYKFTIYFLEKEENYELIDMFSKNDEGSEINLPILRTILHSKDEENKIIFFFLKRRWKTYI